MLRNHKFHISDCIIYVFTEPAIQKCSFKYLFMKNRQNSCKKFSGNVARSRLATSL